VIWHQWDASVSTCTGSTSSERASSVILKSWSRWF
jgi:hypothetical protein